MDPLVQIWNRARSSHQALGHHQVHSGGRDMWNISAEIYQIRLCSSLFAVILVLEIYEWGATFEHQFSLQIICVDWNVDQISK